MKGFARVTLLALAMGLTACGGSDDPPAPAATDTPTVPAVPAVATPATPQGLDVYVGTWVDPVGLVCTKVADVGSTRYPTCRSTAQAASITRADNSLTLSRVALTFGTPDCTGSAVQSAAAPVWTGTYQGSASVDGRTVDRFMLAPTSQKALLWLEGANLYVQTQAPLDAQGYPTSAAIGPTYLRL